MKSLRFAMPAVCLLALAGCDTDIDYEAATADERQEWLTSHAGTMNSGFRAGLWASGAGGLVSVEEPLVQASSRRIVLAARMQAKDVRLNTNSGKIKSGLLASMCPTYVKTLLARKNIKVVVNLLHADGTRILGVEQSPESCAKFA